MGNASSVADGKAEEVSQELTDMLQALSNKREQQLADLKRTRGDADAVMRTEVAGGRSSMRVTEIRVATSTDVSSELKAAITDFFNAAQSGIAEKDTAAKHAAVSGAQNLLIGGLKALLGVSKGRSMEKRDFVVLFLNNAFVRVDYYVYTYSVSAEKWGAEAKKAGSCYIADMAVLDIADLHVGEIDFLVSQALNITPDEAGYLNMIKVKLVESHILSKMLQDLPDNLDEIDAIASKWTEVNTALNDAYNQLKPHTLVPAK